jgi:hypothetical protein
LDSLLQDELKLGLQGSAVPAGPSLKPFDDGLIEIADQDFGHGELLSLSPGVQTIYYRPREAEASAVWSRARGLSSASWRPPGRTLGSRGEVGFDIIDKTEQDGSRAMEWHLGMAWGGRS